MLISLITLAVGILLIITIFTTKRQATRIEEAVGRLTGMISGMVSQSQATRSATGTGPALGQSAGASTGPTAAFDSSALMAVEVCEKCGAFKPKGWFCYVCKGPKKSGRPIDGELIRQLSMEASREKLTAEQLIQSRAVCLYCGVVKPIERPCPGCGRS